MSDRVLVVGTKVAISEYSSEIEKLHSGTHIEYCRCINKLNYFLATPIQYFKDEFKFEKKSIRKKFHKILNKKEDVSLEDKIKDTLSSKNRNNNSPSHVYILDKPHYNPTCNIDIRDYINPEFDCKNETHVLNSNYNIKKGKSPIIIDYQNSSKYIKQTKIETCLTVGVNDVISKIKDFGYEGKIIEYNKLKK